MAETTKKEGKLQKGAILSNGRYKIEGYLASGGFGNTYLATDMVFDETVAIKELFIKGICGRGDDGVEVTISLADNQRSFSAHQEKFRKEARRLHKLSNAHIVRVPDLFDENNTSYYVMDYIEGESLKARLKRTKKPMTEAEVMMILPQVLDALEYVHKESIWHLDLKPANIMMDAKGNIVLIDFGASKQVKNAKGESLSTSSAMVYSRGFAPAEQMEQCLDKFGPWTDLYALGATMYNLLTMQDPPSQSDINEGSHEAFNLPKGISKKTEQLIFWLMKPNRKMRPQSVTDVKQFLVEEPDPTSDPSACHKEEEIKDEDDTIFKKQESSVKEKETDKRVKQDKGSLKKIVIAALAVVCLGGGIILFMNNKGASGDKGGNATDTTVNVPVKNVKDLAIVVMAGPDNMRQYLYTGELADSLGARPNGKGIARFAKYGDIPASTYEGHFVNGICEDNTGTATMTFDTGDKYVGSFKGGFYSEGKYMLSDKSYFKGSFKNGVPHNGTWYNADGTFSAKVVDGKEVE
ncbi:MAG: protein kinase [Bacteroidales bacterium]|nr:protein kinase [Bacteroidales bacterium]